ncbi:transmembrane 220 family protein [Akkermansiaceae bacterium]|nr:transmembrane 220 family protein [Akkermansiaceae bacterium]MDB4544739.1 transmembrane 220 family protein [Akkermansiaceae bacterium]
MKIANFLLAALFALFAWFQRNDIDPTIYSKPSFNNPALDSALWFLFYLIIAVGFVVVSFRKLPKWYFIVAIIACAFEMTMSGPGLWENIFGDKPATMAQTSMSAEDPRVELSREFFGAVIALAGVCFQLWQNRRIKKA